MGRGEKAELEGRRAEGPGMHWNAARSHDGFSGGRGAWGVGVGLEVWVGGGGGWGCRVRTLGVGVEQGPYIGPALAAMQVEG